MTLRSTLPRWTPEQYRSRPDDLDPSLGERVCQRAANGETLSEICQDLSLPLPATFLRWTREDPALAQLWQQAQLDRLDVLSEECVMIADQASDALLAGTSMRARQWLAERLNPKKFAQRTVSVGLAAGDADEGAGVDYGREVRRKLEAMADRRKSLDHDVVSTVKIN